MRYLITGGTGLIGQHLIKRLSQTAENEITVLTRDIKKASGKLNGVELVNVLTEDIIEGCDVVINLMGEPIADRRWTLNQKDRICHSRWHITEVLAALIKQAQVPPKVLLSGSAIGIYGRQGNQALDEDFTQYHPEFSNIVCQRWEQAALLAKSDKTRVVLLRTGIVLAAKGGALAKMLTPFKWGLGGKIATGEQIMSWIHIDDMVSAIEHIINNEQLSGAINMTAPNPVNNAEFCQQLATTLNRPCVVNMPKFLLELMFGEMSDLLIYGQRVIPKKLIDSGFRFAYSELDQAMEQLFIKAS